MTRLLAFVTASLLVALPSPAQDEAPRVTPAFVVIVHPGNTERDLDRRFVAEAFLKKNRYWPSGAPIRPVDLLADSPVRARFSEQVLKRDVTAVKSYWQQQVFSGREVPPPELRSDAEVVEYVRRHPGAIGYVSARAELTGVKALRTE